jgi:tellurite methyltransferase
LTLLYDVAVRDVSEQPPLPDSFDVIVVCRFLDRNLCPAIAAALKPGGILFYQTFTQGLSNPDYLLRNNELITLFSELDILEYHEPEPDAHGKAEARLVARKNTMTA